MNAEEILTTTCTFIVLLMGSRKPPAEETPTAQPCTLLVRDSFSRNRKLFKIYEYRYYSYY